MLNYNDSFIREHMYDGLTGLELESQRVDVNGNLVHTPHPFPGDKYIDRDFGEAQTEISADVAGTVEGALDIMHGELTRLHRKLNETGELLWPFSNPPIIRNEDDIEIARYSGENQASYDYRVYLAEKYGKYKMAYSGIHFNYSFSDDILRRGAELSGTEDYRNFKDTFYLDLAERVLEYSWLPVALMASSSVADGSLFDKKCARESTFAGFATLRCSEFGYWNTFVPSISYENIISHVHSMDIYVRRGLLIAARELYYPVRLKPPGKYTIEALAEKGVEHIELRMIDVNPYARDGMDIRDLRFLQLWLIWLSSLPHRHLSENEQMQAIYNHKSASQYSWSIARIALPGRKPQTLEQVISEVLYDMKYFFDEEEQALADIDYQMNKLRNKDARYAHMVRRDYKDKYIEKGIERAREIQDSFLAEK